MYNMNKENVSRHVKFPENKEIRSQLLPGDRKTIAKYSGYTQGSINEMLNGYRRLTDKAKIAIIQLMEERKEINKSMEEITITKTETGPKPDNINGNVACAFE